VTLDGETVSLRLLSRAGNNIRFSCGGVDKRAASARDGDELWLDFDGACRRFVDLTYAPPRLKDEDSDGAVRSPVSGVIVGVEAKVGDEVRRGQALATVEAMKMQYSILAPIDGVVQTANAAAGAQAQARAILFAIEPHGAR
jgi:geranyl-CoA carboxylase alpha subunit